VAAVGDAQATFSVTTASRDDRFLYYEPFTMCRLCSGPLLELGKLGHLMHYRCRNCGVDARPTSTK
jgi:hypothetical protein